MHANILLVLSPLLLAWLAVPVTALAGKIRTSCAPKTGIVLAALTFAAALAGWLRGGGRIFVPWATSWNLNLAFELDGLAALYTLLAAGIGLLVLIYSEGYLPQHLHHEGQSPERGVSFYVLLVFFMASMIGLVMSQDLLLLFVFWDLTTIASYFLIGFDFHQEESHRAALMALLVTGITSILLLIGALVLHAEYETFYIPDLLRMARPGALLTGSVSLIGLAALAKSALVPFHFWLPRAMAAPTPVSAYLHSAAMVAAGVFLLSRIQPLLLTSRVILDTLIVVGLVSMGVGGIFALREAVLKRVLAYSTIAQYGYVVFLIGLGTPTAAVGASFYVIAHALMKSSLFLTAGAITQATDQDRLANLGGLARSMPWLAAGSGVAAAGLAGLHLTLGFFKDEILFQAALERGAWLAAAVVINAALTLAYTWRFWSGIFLGPTRAAARSLPGTMTFPVIILAALILLGGIFWDPFARLASAAASAAWGRPLTIELAYHLDARLENVMAISVYLLGAVLTILRPILKPLLNGLSRVGARMGPEHGYSLALRFLNRGSASLHNFEFRDLANRITTILIPTAVLIAAGLWFTPTYGVYQVGEFRLQDLPLGLALLLTAISAFAVTVSKHRMTQVLVLSSVNFGLAGVFAFLGAPNLALVSVLIGVVSTVAFFAVFSIFPPEALREEAAVAIPEWRKQRDRLIGILVAGVTFLVAWGVLSQPAYQEGVASRYVSLAPAAHAKDVVTAILADWRGLDTMGEVTVLAVILVGISSFLQRRRQQ